MVAHPSLVDAEPSLAGARQWQPGDIDLDCAHNVPGQTRGTGTKTRPFGTHAGLVAYVCRDHHYPGIHRQRKAIWHSGVDYVRTGLADCLYHVQAHRKCRWLSDNGYPDPVSHCISPAFGLRGESPTFFSVPGDFQHPQSISSLLSHSDFDVGCFFQHQGTGARDCISRCCGQFNGFREIPGGPCIMGTRANTGEVAVLGCGRDGHLKIPHLWPGQNPPGDSRE